MFFNLKNLLVFAKKGVILIRKTKEKGVFSKVENTDGYPLLMRVTPPGVACFAGTSLQVKLCVKYHQHSACVEYGPNSVHSLVNCRLLLRLIPSLF